ncbi:MAG: DNA (cytosine-5-)-methyltransferase [Moraxella sp.]|nr:DNA (cytosine-5-)-methyltransferase [Moraxella sp.]
MKVFNKLTFVDFCSGIGAGRLGLENAGMKCVAHSEIDSNPDLTYQLFFDDISNLGDLTKLNPDDLPNFDVMLAGFPCQTFSIVGKRAGMNDDRGQIIYYLTDILKRKNTPFFILENVKGLINHNKGETLTSILELLSDAGYQVYYQVLDSQYYGVPQMRERVYFVGIRKDIVHTPFEFPKPINANPIDYYLSDDRDYGFDNNNPTFQKYLASKYNNNQYNIDEIVKTDYQVIDWRQSDFRLYENKSPTLRTGRHGILYTKNGKLRKLSGYEALLLQGFPKEIAKKVIEHKLPDSKILSQAGNAMTVTVIEALGRQLLKAIGNLK